jgi:hypothetical protein
MGKCAYFLHADFRIFAGKFYMQILEYLHENLSLAG